MLVPSDPKDAAAEYLAGTCFSEVMGARKPNLAVRAVRFATFYGAYLMFGMVGLVTSILALPLVLVMDSSKGAVLGQAAIHQLFRFFVWYLERCGLLALDATELKKLQGEKNLILVANHPSLLDAVFVAARVPNLCCVMKASVVSNVFICGQATLAGYVNNKSGAAMVKACRRRLRQGCHLLIFPEGTRTPEELGHFKQGFALLARLAGCPIQTLIIRYSCSFLGKRWPFLRPPSFPLHCSIQLGPRFVAKQSVDDRELGRCVEAYYRSLLSQRFRGGLH